MIINDEALYDKFEDLAEKLSNKLAKIRDNAIELTIEKNQEILQGTAGAQNSSSIIKHQVKNQIDQALYQFNKEKAVLVEEIENQLLEHEITLSQVDYTNINQKLAVISKEILGQTAILTNDIQKILLGGLGQGVKESVLVAELTALYPAYSRHAYTIINTGLQRLYIDTTTAKYEKRNYEFYTWAGPNDMLTRDNPCKQFVWHYFYDYELPQLRSIRMRLYNCRHSISPITEEQAKTMPRGDVNAYRPYVPKKGLKRKKK